MNFVLIALILTFLCGFALSFFFSGFETGGYSLSAIRFELRKAKDYRGARILASHLDNMPAVIATTLVGTNLGNYMLTAAVVGLMSPYDPQTREILSTLILTPFVFVFAEVLPKEFFRRHADEIMYKAAGIFRLGHRFFLPATSMLSVVPILLRLVGLTPKEGRSFNPSTLERFSIELTRGTEEGVLSPNQATMARRIMSLGNRTVQNAMVPLWRVVKWDLTLEVDQAKLRMMQLPYSRIPVYKKSSSNLVGTVWVYDVCFGEKESLEEYLEPAYFLRETTPIDVALLNLRKNQVAIAFVQDSRERVIGIITLKDLVAEIVTDLHDL
jgi:putative hemolysin